MIPPLLPDDHPLLAKQMPRFDFAVDDAKEIAATLVEAMTYYDGIGLAANQIGIEKSAFTMETATSGPIVLFNPLVTWLTAESEFMTEGCLTFPGLGLKISRPTECQIRYQTENGETVVKHFTGIEARCALHEMDHLLGVVFTEKVSKLKLTMARKKLKKRLT